MRIFHWAERGVPAFPNRRLLKRRCPAARRSLGKPETPGPARRVLLGIFLGAGFAVLVQAAAQAAPQAKLWPRWQAHDPNSHLAVDHRPWQGFLDRFLLRQLREINLVRYRAVGPAARVRLKDYLGVLSRVPVSRLNRDAQRAYWINLYNAMTVDVILDYYPVKSIREINISPGWFTRGPWGAKRVKVEKTGVSLDDIEHRILRPIWRDARLHYVLNCAAMSCPSLLETAFTAKNTESLLTRAARRYVNHPWGVRIRGGKLKLSSIYFWYRSDFGATDAAVIGHIMKFARPALARRLKREKTFVDGGYNWSLNNAP